MNIDIKLLKKLREETFVSYDLCRKALSESGNDMEQAKKLLASWGADIAAKKASRQTVQGALFSYIHHNKKVGVLVELLCETDFVASNADFQALGADIAIHTASQNPQEVDELLAQPFVKDPDKTIDNLIKEYILKIGENIKVGRFIRYEI